MKIFFILAAALSGTLASAQKQKFEVPVKFDDAIPVLNMGTFHMGFTPDANSTEFDEHNKENQQQIHEIAKEIARFKPTVIVVEMQPSSDHILQQEYQEYCINSGMAFEKPSEIELLAYEVGRLSGATKIYGIDYQQGYNYRIASALPNSADFKTYERYMNMMDDFEKKFPEDNLPVRELLTRINHSDYLNFLINVNADILTHIASENGSEGADEAAKYYHRNLVMYSNFNKLPIGKDDRVFMLMGASHTAFFSGFMGRSWKYELESVFGYLGK